MENTPASRRLGYRETFLSEPPRARNQPPPDEQAADGAGSFIAAPIQHIFKPNAEQDPGRTIAHRRAQLVDAYRSVIASRFD